MLQYRTLKYYTVLCHTVLHVNGLEVQQRIRDKAGPLLLQRDISFLVQLLPARSLLALSRDPTHTLSILHDDVKLRSYMQIWSA